jgi:hypothetical protein
MGHKRCWALAALVLVLPLSANAQNLIRHPKGLFGFNGSLIRPTGEFRDYVDWGGGLGVYGVVNVNRRHQIGLRMGTSLVIYGHESYPTQISPSIGRVWVDVNTENLIVDFGVGPQITFGRGPLRPYIYGTAGLSYFATVSSLDGVDGGPDFAHTTNFDDITLALTGGGGFLVSLSRRVAIDMSAQWTQNDDVEYLTRGDIVDNWDGSITMYPIRSEANMMTFRFGLAIVL